MAQMWQQNLGVNITIENLEPDRYMDLVNSGQHGQLFSSGWCGDYPDPENFADVLFHTGAQENRGKYSNPELDAILDTARLEQDVSKRIQLYQQAEQIIVQDAPALFILNDMSYELVRPTVKGFVLLPIGIPIGAILVFATMSQPSGFKTLFQMGEGFYLWPCFCQEIHPGYTRPHA